MQSVKQILITEEQLNKILREEFCSFTSNRVGDDFTDFLEGLKLTLELSFVADKIISRLFHKEDGNETDNV